ncbi:hypothetical protein MLD38_008811 [Melastoma candidum]|uniref:Uncharacterized protein n=1 Tax=Melastoma candidum TaxID=119954 RepID=A0ACB9RXG3_9MYRT|nr:hypothetical protein MLD38_008811 [Melastoma candidum]
MANACPEGASSSHVNKLIRELLRGRELATQLQSLLSESPGDGKAVLAEQMLGEIMRSFSESISVMGSCGSPEASEGVMSGDSGESPKRPGSKEGRGCYKRRRGLQSPTVIAPTKEDGYAWRKYGQKEILNSKFPRCYYRCTHKYDQGCKATKQVQMMDDHPTMYQITYHGQHSCREIMRAPQMIPDLDPRESNVPGTHHHDSKPQTFHQDNRPSNPFPMCIKDEQREDSASDLTDCKSGLDQGFPDLPGFGNFSEPATDFSSWPLSDDSFGDFPATDFMSRYISINDEFHFACGKLDYSGISSPRELA